MRCGVGRISWLLCLAAPAMAAGDEELLIFALRLDGRTVADSLSGFPDGQGGYRFAGG